MTVEAAAGRPRSGRAPAGLVGLGAAFPPTVRQDELWGGFFADHYGDDRRAERIWRHAGVEQRHAVADPRREDLRFLGTAERMRRFLRDGVPLGIAAVEACLEDARLEPADVDLLTVVSCTGYGTPGVDVRVAAALGLGAHVQRLHIGHMGCYAAVPGLMATADAAAARGETGVMLCLELPSLHIQPPTDDVEQVVAHALFSDAAVAAALVPRSAGFEVVGVVARTDVDQAPLMTWDVTDLGFRMGLSPDVPAVLARQLPDAVQDLLGASGMRAADVRGWAIHPGGPAILDVVQERLELPDEDVRESRAVLAEHGNCSAPTVLLVLDRVRRERELTGGDPVVLMAFGPGLTLYAALLTWRG